jgi:hypothetical protein
MKKFDFVGLILGVALIQSLSACSPQQRTTRSQALLDAQEARSPSRSQARPTTGTGDGTSSSERMMLPPTAAGSAWNST